MRRHGWSKHGWSRHGWKRSTGWIGAAFLAFAVAAQAQWTMEDTLHEAPDADGNWNALSLPFVVGPHGRIGKLDPAALKASDKSN